jgi:hypothetical protein
MYNAAKSYYTGDIGYHPWTGSTVAALDPNINTGLQRQVDMANAQLDGTGNEALGLSQLLGRNIIGQEGLGALQQQAWGTLGQATGQYSNIYQQAASQPNPYLPQVLNTVQDRINAAMSGAGRYGSGAYDAAIAQGMAEPLLQDYQARQQEMLAATQGLGQTQGQIAGIGQSGLQLAGQFGQQIPGLMQAQYLPIQQQMAAGQYMQDRAQQDLAGQIQLWNAQNAYPWQQLEREAAILAGAGQLGGTQVTAQTPQQAPALQRLLGGALVGGGLGSAFGPVGTGVGALGGAGLGYFM